MCDLHLILSYEVPMPKYLGEIKKLQGKHRRLAFCVTPTLEPVTLFA